MMKTLIRTTALLAGIICSLGAKPAPDMQFRDLSGGSHKLSSLRGSVAVVTFWATWCEHCREEMQMLAGVEQSYKANDVHVVTVSVDDAKDRGKVEGFVREQKIELNVWTGADVDTLDRLKLPNVVPATIVLDQGGEIVGRIEGEARESDISGYVNWLLAARKGDAPPAVIKRY